MGRRISGRRRDRSPLRGLAMAILMAASGLLLAVALAEAAVRVLNLFAQQRQLVVAGMDSSARDDRAAGIDGASRFFLHPFQGWTVKPRKSSEAQFTRRWSRVFPEGVPTEWALANRNTNALGFLSYLDDYREVEDEDLVVLIVGGSVAAQLALFGGDAIRSALGDGERVVQILNGASGGYKQPQQLFVASQLFLLGVPIDIVVNLDGVNEVRTGASDATKGYHPLLPSRAQYQKTLALYSNDLTAEELELSGLAVRKRRQARGAMRFLGESLLGRLEVGKAFGGVLVQRLIDDATTLESEMQEVARSNDEREVEHFSLGGACLGSECSELIQEIWFRSSLALERVAEANGARYFHFLQPSQYVVGSKPLSAEEQEGAYRPAGWTARLLRLGYPNLIEAGSDLVANDVSFHDLRMLFRDVDQTLYSDDCCHLNWAGYQLLGQEIGRVIASQLRSE